MGLFTNTERSAAIPAAPAMPNGYDDPGSRYFIAEELRPFYTEATDTARSATPVGEAMEKAAHILAWDEAQEELGAAPGPVIPAGSMFLPRGALNDIRGQVYYRAVKLAPEIQMLRASEVLALALHLIRLDTATAALEAEMRKQKRRSEFEARYTCPVCRACDPGRNGEIKHRRIGDRVHGITSCAACHMVAVAEYLDQARKEPAEWPHRTRLDAVRAELAQTNEKGN